MRFIILCPALIGLASLIVTPALSEPPPPPPEAGPGGAAPPRPLPPPPQSPGAGRAGEAPPEPPPPPPLPPRAAAVILDHWQNGAVHVDVHCTEAETTKACVDIATQLFDRLNGTASTK